MKQYLTIFILVSVFSSIGFATVGYDIHYLDNSLNMTASILLKSAEDVDIYNLTWSVPKNSYVVSIEDESGPIKSYSVDKSTLSFITNADPDKRNELIKIRLIQNNIFNYTFYPFGFFDINLPSFENEDTIAVINTSNIITTFTPFKFSIESDGDLRLEGKGPLSFRSYTGSAKENGYYYTFSDNDITESNENYGLVAGTIGIIPFYTKFPLLIDSEDQYNDIAESYSAGTYRSGGLIIVKDTDNINPVILHETTHAYNNQIMSWKESKGSWFDEGTAQYVEWLADIKLKQRVPSLFGSDIKYIQGSYIYTLKSHGDREMLWDYYQGKNRFISSWTPEDSNRDFGYALSELIIRKFVMDNGPEALHKVYEKLSQFDHTVVSNKEFDDTLDIDMMPCYNENKQEFEKCLDDINKFEPRILSYSGSIENKKSSTTIKSFEETYGSFEYLKNQTKTEIQNTSKDLLSSIIDAILLFLKNLFM